jgi:hypothetical protein
LSDSFPIPNGLKQGDALSRLLLNFILEYAIKKVKENQVGLTLNGTHQLLDHADDVTLLGGTMTTMKKNTVTFFYVNREVGLEINTEKTKYVLLSRHQKCRSISGHRSNKQILLKCVKVQIFGIDINKSKFDSRGN